MWVSDHTRDDLYWRSAMSGGRDTVRRRFQKKGTQTQGGDISAIDPMGDPLIKAFSIECKHLNQLDYHMPVYGLHGKLVKAWRQTRKKAKQCKLAPLLIAKQNFKEEMVFSNKAGAILLLTCGMPQHGIRIILPTYGIFGFYFRDILLLPYRRLRRVLYGKNSYHSRLTFDAAALRLLSLSGFQVASKADRVSAGRSSNHRG